MTIRPYRTSDREEVVALQQKHPDLFFADPEDPVNASTLVAVKDGRVVGVLTGRRVVESFLVVDPDMDPLPRWRMMRALFREGFAVARDLGFREALSSVPPRLSKYADLLGKLEGFQEDTRRRFAVRLSDSYRSNG